MLARLRIKGLERILAGKRTLSVLLSDYTEEMDLFKELFKAGVEFRIKNDGSEFSLEPLNKYATNVAKIDYLRYKYTINTLRQVVKSGSGYSRKTKMVKWKALADVTLADRDKLGYSYPTYPRLYRTGEMLKSVVKSGYGHFEHVWRLGFRIGADNIVASVLNDGNSKIPARPFFYLSTDLYFYYRKILQLKINSAFRMLRSVAKY